MTIKPQQLPQAQINSVIDLFTNGQIQEALDSVGALIKDYPDEAILYNISGACYASLVQLDTAVKFYFVRIKYREDVKMKKPIKDMSLMKANSDNIVLFYPHVSELAKSAVMETLNSRWIGQGPRVKLFEENFFNNWRSWFYWVSSNSPYY